MPTLPSLRRLALGELDAAQLEVMIGEGESLFVEEKTSMGERARQDGFQLAKAAASFANTMGGWILVGLRDGKPTDWVVPRNGFVDAVRQRLQPHVDPLPAFAARVVEHAGHPIGVVRVYESTDTPHVLSDGSIVVREPAQDSRLRGRYEATPIRSNYELQQLASRGARAEAASQKRLDRPSPINGPLNLRVTRGDRPDDPDVVQTLGVAIVVRWAPVTVPARWEDWAASRAAVETFAECLGVDGRKEVPVQPLSRGLFSFTDFGDFTPWTPGGHMLIATALSAAVDAGGVLGVRTNYHLRPASGNSNYHRPLEPLTDLSGQLAHPLLVGADILQAAELYGRYLLRAHAFGLNELYRVDPDRPDVGTPPPRVDFDAELTIDGTAFDDARAIAAGWARQVSRASGLALWE